MLTGWYVFKEPQKRGPRECRPAFSLKLKDFRIVPVGIGRESN